MGKEHNDYKKSKNKCKLIPRIVIKSKIYKGNRDK